MFSFFKRNPNRRYYYVSYQFTIEEGARWGFGGIDIILDGPLTGSTIPQIMDLIREETGYKELIVMNMVLLDGPGKNAKAQGL